MGWYLAVIKKYAVFSGRARRKEYWMFILFNTLAHSVLYSSRYAPSTIAWWWYERTGHVPRILPGLELFFIVLFFAYLVAVLVPGLAVVVRRLHDTGRSGLWLLWGLPGLGFAMVLRWLNDIGHRTISPAWALLPIGVAIAVIFRFTVIKGTAGKNKYGPDPKA
ncbi:MAG: DUF805 domain-containing protein [Treponema sp.]|nr:DUF805 domain-containing protein [Treponema sp.]